MGYGIWDMRVRFAQNPIWDMGYGICVFVLLKKPDMGYGIGALSLADGLVEACDQFRDPIDSIENRMIKAHVAKVAGYQQLGLELAERTPRYV
jgi:hypothetical protein